MNEKYICDNDACKD